MLMDDSETGCDGKNVGAPTKNRECVTSEIEVLRGYGLNAPGWTHSATISDQMLARKILLKTLLITGFIWISRQGFDFQVLRTYLQLYLQRCHLRNDLQVEESGHLFTVSLASERIPLFLRMLILPPSKQLTVI